MLNKKSFAVLFTVLSCGGSLTAFGATTNVWLTAAGGDWRTPGNWSLGHCPQPTEVAVMTNLVNGAVVRDTQGFTCTALVAGCAGADGTWTLDGQWDTDYYMNFSFSGNVCELSVQEGCTLNLKANVCNSTKNAVTVKRGGGRLRVLTYWGENILQIEEGTVVAASENALSGAAVKLPDYAGALELECSSRVGGFLAGNPAASVRLNGFKLKVGGYPDPAVFDGVLTGPGTLAMSRGADQKLLTSPENVENVEIAFGNLTLGEPAEKGSLALRFNDPDNPALDSSGAAELAEFEMTGNVQITTDPERGSVAYFDGDSWLKGTRVPALPSGSDKYTVAFWLKAESDCNATAKIFGWGETIEGQYCGLRRESGGKWLFTNWGNNSIFQVNDTVWHHYAFVRGAGNGFDIYIDGQYKFSNTPASTLALSPCDLFVGYGWGDPAFKGWMDDFTVYPYSLSAFQVAHLAADGITAGEAVKLPTSTRVEVSQNGKLTIDREGQTVAGLSGSGVLGGVAMRGGDLTVAGEGTGTDTYSGGLSGDGKLVLDAPGRTLVLDGETSHTGGAHVKAGTLVVRGQGAFARVNMSNADRVAHFRFDKPLEAGADTCGNGDLPAAGRVSVVEDPERGRVLRFSPDSVEGFKLASAPESYPVGDSMRSVSVWLKPGNDCGVHAGILQMGGTSANELFLIRFESMQAIRCTWYGGQFDCLVDRGINLRDGAWHHLAVTYDGTKLVVYIDGAVQGEYGKSNFQTAAGKPVLVGWQDVGVDQNRYEGLMDDLSLYTRALSADEVAAIASGAGEAVESVDELPAPVAWYRFADAENPGLDSSGNGYDLRSVGPNVRVRKDAYMVNALDLTGSSGQTSYLMADTFPAKIPTGRSSYTVSCWVRAGAGLDDSASAVFWGEGDNMMLLGTYGREHGLTMRLVPKAYADIYNEGFFIKPDASSRLWHHVVARYDGTCDVRELFIDGCSVQKQEGSGLAREVPAKNFFIGRKLSSATAWWNGCLADVRIFDVALPDSSVRTLARTFESAGNSWATGWPVTVDAGATLRVENDSVVPLTASAFPIVSGAGSVEILGNLTFAEVPGVKLPNERYTVVSGGTVSADISAWTLPAALSDGRPLRLSRTGNAVTLRVGERGMVLIVR